MGRKAGGQNRNRTFTLNKLQEMWGVDFDPLMQASESAFRMTEIAKANKGGEDEFVQHKECVSAWEKVAQYIQPKLKAVEHSGAVAEITHEEWLRSLEDEEEDQYIGREKEEA